MPTLVLLLSAVEDALERKLAGQLDDAVGSALAFFDKKETRSVSAAALRALPWDVVERGRDALFAWQSAELLGSLAVANESHSIEKLKKELAKAQLWLTHEHAADAPQMPAVRDAGVCVRAGPDPILPPTAAAEGLSAAAEGLSAAAEGLSSAAGGSVHCC